MMYDGTPDRKHAIRFSDAEVSLLNHALLAYAAVLRIQTNAESRFDADRTARVSSLIQLHLRCDCETAKHPKGEH